MINPQKADFDLVSRIAEELHCGHNQILGGYISQPISLYELANNQYMISGWCVLKATDSRCSYVAPQRELTDLCWGCSYYQALEKKWIDEQK